MHFNLNPIGMFIIASLTLFLSLTNAYMEIPRLETHERRHGNITIDFTFFDPANNGSTTCNSTFLPSTSTQTYYPGGPFSIACKNDDFRWYFNTFDNSSSFSIYLQHSYKDTASIGGYNTLEGTSDTISPPANKNFTCRRDCCHLDERKGPILVAISGVSGK